MSHGGFGRRTPRPIFVFGIQGRSGTNYLRNLLLLHPDCMRPERVPEDQTVKLSGPLFEYAEAISHHLDL